MISFMTSMKIYKEIERNFKQTTHKKSFDMIENEFVKDYVVLEKKTEKSKGNILDRLFKKDISYLIRIIDKERTEATERLECLRRKRNLYERYKNGELLSEDEESLAKEYDEERKEKSNLGNRASLGDENVKKVIDNTVKESLSRLKKEVEEEIRIENKSKVKEELDKKVEEELERINKKRNKAWERVSDYMESNGVSKEVLKFMHKKLGHIPNEKELKRRINLLFQKRNEELGVAKTFKENHKTMYFGTTGIGKTSTIVKLVHKEDKKESLVLSTDTIRTGAKDEIEKLGEKHNFEARYLGEIENKINEEEIDKYKYIHLDLPGTNPRNIRILKGMKKEAEKVGIKKKTLIINATQNNKDIIKSIDNYDELGVDSVIVTKMDETSHPGIVFNVIYHTKVPIDYITNGQNVTAFIQEFDSKNFLKYFWKDFEFKKGTQKKDLIKDNHKQII